MAFVRKTVPRTVYDESNVAVCDGCGVEVPVSGDPEWAWTIPQDWFRAAQFTPGPGLLEHVIGCSVPCLIRGLESKFATAAARG